MCNGNTLFKMLCDFQKLIINLSRNGRLIVVSNLVVTFQEKNLEIACENVEVCFMIG